MAHATLENIILIFNMFPKSQIETLNHPKWSKQRPLHNCVVMPKPYKRPHYISTQMEPQNENHRTWKTTQIELNHENRKNVLNHQTTIHPNLAQWTRPTRKKWMKPLNQGEQHNGKIYQKQVGEIIPWTNMSKINHG
jgi:hypothetical protein